MYVGSIQQKTIIQGASEQMHKFSKYSFVLLFTFILLWAVPAMGQEDRRDEGRIVVGFGVALQGVSIGLAVASFWEEDLLVYRIPYELAIIPFAPMTVRGFELALGNSDDRMRARSLGIGLLEGAIYSSAISIISLINLGTHKAYQKHMCDELGQTDYCFEDYTDSYIAAHLIPHATIAAIFFISSIASFNNAHSSPQMTAFRLPFNLCPVFSKNQVGISISGIF